jgi:hypothetical protein
MGKYESTVKKRIPTNRKILEWSKVLLLRKNKKTSNCRI